MITVPAFRSAFRGRGARRIPDERLSRGRTAAAGRRTAAVCAALAVLVAGLAAAPAHADEQPPPPLDEAQAAPAGAAPDRPTGLTATAAHDRVALSWDDPGDPAVTGYEILRRDRAVDAVGTFHTIEDDTATAATAYTDTTVTAGGSYVYRVKALNAHGASRWSSYARADIPQPPVIEAVEPPEPEPDPEPTAQPQSDCADIWCATLTVGTRADQLGMRPALSSLVLAYGSLDPAMFSHGGSAYTVTAVYYRSSGSAGLYLGISPLPSPAVRQTLALAIGDDRYPLDAERGGELYWSDRDPGWSSGDSVELALKLNSAATGKPTVSGRAQAAQLLVAERGTISDPNGSTGAELGCQWQRGTAGTFSDIESATECTYIPVAAADVGSELRVQVTFTDSDGFTETVSSDATGIVVASPYTNEIWSATLTTPPGGNPLGYAAPNVLFSTEVGGLDNKDFNRGPTAHTVRGLLARQLASENGRVALYMNEPLREDFALQIADRQILLEDLYFGSSSGSVLLTDDGFEYRWFLGPEMLVMLEPRTDYAVSILARPEQSSMTPTASITANRTVAPPRGKINLAAVVSNPGGHSLSHQWTSPGGGSFTATNSPETVYTTPSSASGSVFPVILTVSFDGDMVRDYEFIRAVVNRPPQITDLTAQPTTVDSGGTVRLAAKFLDPDDPNGDYATYRWDHVSTDEDESEGTFNPANELTTTWTAPIVRTTTEITLKLTVIDEKNATASRQVIVTVNAAANPLRVTIVGGNQTVPGNEMLALTGAVAGALDPDDVEYAWTATGGVFSATNTADTTWTAPSPTRNDRTFTLTLAVTEGTDTASDTVTVAVPANQRPTLTILAVGEVTGGKEVPFGVTASDDENDTLSYRWTTVPDTGNFPDPDSPTVLWEPPSAGEQDVVFTLRVTVTDAVASDPVTATKTVTVLQNQPPAVEIDEPPDEVAGGAAVPLTVTATDPEGDTLTYAWSAQPDLGSFGAVGTHGSVTWTAPPAERDPQDITLTLTVTDDGAGARSTSQSVTVTVRAKPQSDDCADIWCATLTISENIAQTEFGASADGLSPNTFTYSSTDYTVTEVVVTASNFILKTSPGMGRTLSDPLTLTIIDDGATTDYPLADASLNFGSWYIWRSNLPNWAGRVGDTVDVELSIAVINNEATGKPTIGPNLEDADRVPATVGQRLTADTADIADTDGIPDDAEFAYQWLRSNDMGLYISIEGASSETYVPTGAVVGRELRVQVTFIDSLGNEETVTSDPTAAVAASPYTVEVWSATLTPADLSNSTLGADASRGTLSPNTFELNNVTYTVTRLAERFATGGVTSLVIEPQLYDTALQIGTRQFLPDQSAGSVPLSNGSLTTWWTTDAVQLLQAGTAVDVKLLTRATDPDAPTVTISGEVSAAPGKTITLTAQAGDPNGNNNTLTYAWSHEYNVRQFVWADPTIGDSDKTAVYTVPTGADPLDYAVASVTVTNAEGKSTTAYKGMSVRSNASPTVSVTANPTTVNSGGTVTLTGDASDPDVPTNLTYQWTSSSGGTFADAAALSTTWTAPTVTGLDDLDVTLTLTVTDDAANTATDTVTVTVLAPTDLLAVFINGGDRTVSGGGTLELTSTVSGLVVQGGETYAWSGAGTFDPVDTATTTWTAPAPTRAEQTFTLTLAVTEGTVTVRDTVTVTVPANQPPTVTGLPTSEEVDGSAELRIIATADDPDDDPLMYTWTDQVGIGSFDNSSVLNTVWTAPAPERYPQDTVLMLTVADSFGDVVKRVNVRVRGNFAPLVSGGIFEVGATDVFFGNNTVHLDQHTVLDPEGDDLTYQWSSSGDLGSFDPPTGQHTIWTTPPATVDQRMVTLMLTVTDDLDTTTFSKVVIVEGNHPPGVTLDDTPTEVDGGGTVALGAAVTNIEGDTLTYLWSATRGTLVDNTQRSTTWTAPAAARTPTQVTLTLTVTDDGAGPGITTKTATITVRADEAPNRPGGLPERLDVAGGHQQMLDGASDSDVTAYAWSTDVGTFAGGTNTAAATWTAPDPSRAEDTGTITLTVTDALGGTVFTIPVTVQADEAPTGSVNADPDTVHGGKAVQLTDRTSDDGQSSVTRVWTASPDVGSFDNTDSPDATWTAPPATAADQPVTLTLTVTDAVGGTDFTTTVTVRKNQPPTVTLGNDEGVGGSDAVTLTPTVDDPENDMLTYAWTAAPDSGTFQNRSARNTTWTAPASTRDAQVVVLTLTVTDDGAGSRQGSDTVTFTVRPLGTVTTVDDDDAPSFMSRHEGIHRDDEEFSDELQWLFPRRVPYTDYAAIGFDGFEVQERSRALDEDWLAWQLLDRVAADDIERAPASRVRYAIAPAPDCWDREWRVRALYSPAEGITDVYQDSEWLYAGDYNRPPDNPTPHTPLIDADSTWMTRSSSGGYELQLAWGLGGRPSDQECTTTADYTYEVQRRYIIGKYWGSGEPQAAGEAHPWSDYENNRPPWWDVGDDGAFNEANWNRMWFNQPEELWSRLYRGIRSSIDDAVNTADVDCDAAPGGIDLFWNPTMVRDGNDIYSEWELLPEQRGAVSVTEDNLTCGDPPTAIEYAVDVYYYQYRVRAHSGGKTSGWAEHRFTSHDLDREPPAQQDDDPVN